MVSVGENRNSRNKDVDRIIENAYTQYEESWAKHDSEEQVKMAGYLVGTLNTLYELGLIDSEKHDSYIYKGIMLVLSNIMED